MGRPIDIRRRAAVLDLLETGLTPRQVGRRLGVTANAVYNVRRRALGPSRGPDRVTVPDAPPCDRCGLRGPHECLSSVSIRWRPLGSS